MAESNPFSHLGQGFLGADVGIAKAAATPGPIFSTNPLKGLIAGGLDKLGVTDFLNSLGGSQPQPQNQAISPVAPPSMPQMGINPEKMATQPEGGLGLNVKPDQNAFVAPKPFSANDSYGVSQQQNDTQSQIRSAWGIK